MPKGCPKLGRVELGQRLVDDSLICPQRTAALQKQGDSFDRETMLVGRKGG
ncbi:MAG: hypothetical protein QOJ84_1471 [Bradyrhizobium sp.]|jgi:hypothetical protein|nr:hypothetical protein [Bradyrhizobium sp.]